MNINAIVKWLKEHAKSLGAAVGGALATLMMKWVNGEVPWPENQQEWINAAIGAVVAGVLAWLPTNKITQNQLDKDPHVIGGTVVDQIPAPSTPGPDYNINVYGKVTDLPNQGGYPSSWR